jgi:hypothetical protein
MMGLTDRLEPWARRLHRAPARAEPERKDAARDDAPRRTGRFARTEPAAPEAPTTRTGRFRRPTLQEQDG